MIVIKFSNGDITTRLDEMLDIYYSRQCLVLRYEAPVPLSEISEVIIDGRTVYKNEEVKNDKV